jgi:hypothetical protein
MDQTKSNIARIFHAKAQRREADFPSFQRKLE